MGWHTGTMYPASVLDRILLATRWTRYLDNTESGFAVYSGNDQHTTYAYDREGFRYTSDQSQTIPGGDPCLPEPAKPCASTTRARAVSVGQYRQCNFTPSAVMSAPLESRSSIRPGRACWQYWIGSCLRWGIRWRTSPTT